LNPKTAPLLLFLALGLGTASGAPARPATSARHQPSVDTRELFTDVQTLSSDAMAGRKTGTPGAASARAFVEKTFKRYGIRPFGASYEHSFAIGSKGLRGINLLGYLPGTAKGATPRYLVLSAHYDHLGVTHGQIYNGADDNASGVAVLLAAARHFHRHPLRHSLLLAAFDAEELGLLGAQAFVAAPPVPLSAIGLEVNLDMVGRGDKGELYAAGTSFHPELAPPLQEVAARSGLTLRFGHDRPGLPPGEDWTESSDHGPFHQKGIPFVYFGVEDHPDYHQPTDDFPKIPQDFFRRSATTILGAVEELDRVILPSS
jgi:hypothetical protein